MGLTKDGDLSQTLLQYGRLEKDSVLRFIRDLHLESGDQKGAFEIEFYS